MAPVSTPSVDELRPVLPSVEGVVGPEHIDLNGHMNVTHYFAAQVLSVRNALIAIGITEEYMTARQMGAFATEHHLRYLDELRRGSAYSTRLLFLDRTDKAVHAISYLVNESGAVVSNVLEVIVVHVDHATRRAVTIPDDIAVRLDEQIQTTRSLDWSPETCLRFPR